MVSTPNKKMEGKEEKKKKMVVEDCKVYVREYDAGRDARLVEEMEQLCDVGPATNCDKITTTTNKNNKSKKKKNKEQPSLFMDLMGDPISRIRHFSDHVMLVAEYGEKRVMAGVVRCCIKTVTRGKKQQQQQLGGSPFYTKVAYILGLRVSPTHRRLGIGVQLVEAVEEWCKQKGAEYAYMATDRSNTASLNLFTKRLSYTRFRSPRVLVHPVHAHRQPLGKAAAILGLPPAVAAQLYRHLFSSSEFFPKDISSILSIPLTLGTFLAVPSGDCTGGVSIGGATPSLPSSFAVMSLWNTKEIYRMQVKGVSAAARALLSWTRAADERMPWMRIPSIPDVFSSSFGVYFMYGLHMEGKGGAGLMRSLCRLAHNMATEDEGCAAVVAEVGRTDPVRGGVPHWRRFSWDEDVWCMKRLVDGNEADDWVRSQPSNEIIFVDPRDF